MNAKEKLRQLSLPHNGDKIEVVIDRTARAAGLSYSRCYEIYYGRARRIEPAEIARISDALEEKSRLDARNELSALRLRLERLESLLAQTDPDFARASSDCVRAQMRRSR